jgi:mannose/cellobiose epimerase-like protein (N-acyl-D-glucosamine 2-epimerase family)
VQPDFRSRSFLLEHAAAIMRFYHPRCMDTTPRGGMYHFFKDDGRVYDESTRHLVSSTRFVVTYAWAYMSDGTAAYLDAVRHGLHFLRQAHRDPSTGGYAWQLQLDDRSRDDKQNYAYGLAFVLLAYATAVKAGVAEALPWLAETWDVLETRFFDSRHGLYADEATPDWGTTLPYRGQNANMHACEAMLAAYEATREARYLDRATGIAHAVCVRQAALVEGGLVWEHYGPDWAPDYEYNRDKPSDLFKPWGHQPGHLVEWAKLLLVLRRHSPDAKWLLPTARRLFDAAWQFGWDTAGGGGFVYSFAPGPGPCAPIVTDKYYWVHAEALAAAAMLAVASGEAGYWAQYDQVWAWAWAHLVDHEHGAWFRILDRAGHKYSDNKCPGGGKNDYHTLGACFDVLAVLPACPHDG